AVQQVCLYMHDPRDLYFTALKRILRYVRGTLHYGLQLHVTLSHSSAEAEYRGVANVVAETAWIRNLLCELYTPLFTTTLVYCDNVSAVYMSANPLQHQRTNHIEIDIHFFVTFLLRDKFVFFMSLQDSSMHIFLRRAYPLLYLLSFAPA
ncbi:ribonuclease H-like domain-containing protein, partial [Tanacetum coccineum]